MKAEQAIDILESPYFRENNFADECPEIAKFIREQAASLEEFKQLALKAADALEPAILANSQKNARIAELEEAMKFWATNNELTLKARITELEEALRWKSCKDEPPENNTEGTEWYLLEISAVAPYDIAFYDPGKNGTEPGWCAPDGHVYRDSGVPGSVKPLRYRSIT